MNMRGAMMGRLGTASARMRVLVQTCRAQTTIPAVVALALCLASLTGWMLLDARKAAFRQAEQAAANLTLSLERDIARNIEIYDLSLKAAAANLGIPGLADASPEVRQAVLFDGASEARYFGRIAIADASGEDIFDSGSAHPRHANFGERDWFIHLRAHPESGLHLSLTPKGLLSGKPSLVLSHPITRADGSFAGAVAGVIFLDYFHQLFAGLALDEGTAINLVTTGGRIVARRPFDERDTGRDISQAEVFRRLRTAPSGSFETQGVIDGVQRLYVYRQLGALPLVVQVGLSKNAIYAEWRHKAWVIVSALVALVGITGLLAWALRQELRHRARLVAQLRTSEAGFRLLTEHASDMVSRVGPDGMRRYVSPAAMRMFGVPAEALLGRWLLDLIRPADLPRVEAVSRQLLAGAVEENGAVFRVHRPDGTEVWIEAAARLLRDPETGAPDGYVAISRDITERRHIEAERELRRRELEAANRQLERLARHLGRARELADQANKAKSRFLAGMSHELRTPLNGILGYAQLLRMEGQLDGKQRKRVDAMLGAGQHLLEMINRVLDLSEIEAETFEMQQSGVDLRQAAEMCLGLVGPAAKAKRLELSLATDPSIPKCVLADPARLRQLLLNLLGNAVKFTDQGTVELRLLAADAATLRVEVADSGPGVSSEQRQLLFQDFERLDASGLVEGAGLGLAISVRLATLMGGRMGHEDNPAGGSVFWLELPMAAAADIPLAAVAARAPQPSRPLRLLVVDDVAMNRDIASSFLRAAGHEVTCAESGAGAVEAAAGRDYDAVLMDLAMPGMDGLEATRRLRALPGPRGQVQIIALTAQAFAEQVEECRLAGMDGHVAKPFTQGALLHAVAGAVERTALGKTRSPASAGPPVGRDGSASSARGANQARHMVGSDLPICDAEAFKRTAALLSASAVSTYLGTLVTRGEALLQDLHRPGIATGRLDALSGAAHALAGSAGMFGFQRLAFVARQFEQAADTASPEMPAIIQGLMAAIESSIREMRSRALAGKAEPVDEDETVNILD